MRHKQKRLLEQNIQHLESYIKEHELKISPEEMILSITEADPDYANFKNSKWLIKNLLNKSFLWEDIEAGKSSKAYDTLSRFLNIRKQWPESNLKDINQYKGLSGIAEKIRPFEITKGMNELKREEKARIYSETIVLYDKNDYLVVIPKTQEASCFWGRNTEWCTASTKSKNYFDYYNKNGPLIIAITPDNHKYQFHKNSTPMDENDEEIKDITDPVLVELAWISQRILHIKEKQWDNPEFCKLAVLYKPESFQHISYEIENYEELCKETISNGDSYILPMINYRTPNYKELCKLAVQNNIKRLGDVSPKAKDYYEICKYALEIKNNKRHLINLSYIDDTFLTKEQYNHICEIAVMANGKNIDDIDINHPRYFELCKHAMIQAPEYYPTICKHFNQEQRTELYNIAIHYSPMVLIYIPEELRTLEHYNIAIKQDSMMLEYISEEFRTQELCMMALHGNPYLLSYIKDYIPEEFMTKEAYLSLFQENPDIISMIPSEYITEEHYLYAINKNAISLQKVPKEFITKEICLSAVQQNEHNMEYINKSMPYYSECLKIAIQKDPYLLKSVPYDLPDYIEICTLAIEKDSSAIRYMISHEYNDKAYRDLCKRAVELAPTSIAHIDIHIPEYIELCYKAISLDPSTLYDIHHTTDEYLDMAKKIIKDDPHNIEYVSRSCDGYYELMESFPKEILESFTSEEKEEEVIPEWLSSDNYKSYFHRLENLEVSSKNHKGLEL